MAYQLTLIGGRIEQRGDLSLGQLLSSHHSYLPVSLVSLRPADQPIQARKSIRVVRLRPKVRQTAALLVPLYRGAPSDRPRENRDGFPLRGAPNTAPHGAIFTRSRKAA